MKNYKTYFLLSLAAIVAVAGLSFSSVGFAQVAPLACTVSASSVGINQQITMTATGGTGSYSWSVAGMASNPTGNSLTVSINVPGDYRVVVVSGAQTTFCNVVVVATEFPTPGSIESPAPSFPNTGGGYGQ